MGREAMNKQSFNAARLAAELSAMLGAASACLVVLGILSMLAAENVEPFRGSVSVLAGLLGGACLVVAGSTGVANRHRGLIREVPTPPEADETRSAHDLARLDVPTRHRQVHGAARYGDWSSLAPNPRSNGAAVRDSLPAPPTIRSVDRSRHRQGHLARRR